MIFTLRIFYKIPLTNSNGINECNIAFKQPDQKQKMDSFTLRRPGCLQKAIWPS